MRNFILKDDFYSIATQEDLDILSGDNDKIIQKCNESAVQEAASYLTAKYDVSKVFADPIEFNSALTWDVGDRIYTVSGETYTHYTCIVSGGTGLTIDDTTYFEEGDGRNAKILQCVLEISLFYIHKRIAPDQIPVHRVLSYDGNGNMNLMSAIKYLTLIQKGEIVPYGLVLLADDPEISDPEVGPDFDLLGNDPSVGIMWGNDNSLDDYYSHYNKIPDPNLKRIDTEDEN